MRINKNIFVWREILNFFARNLLLNCRILAAMFEDRKELDGSKSIRLFQM